MWLVRCSQYISYYYHYALNQIILYNRRFHLFHRHLNEVPVLGEVSSRGGDETKRKDITMKKTLVIFMAMAAFSAFANAGELCGMLGKHMVGPKCNPGQACPHWVRLQYDLTTSRGKLVDLETSSEEILEQFGSLQGQQACVEGSYDNLTKAFEVTSISSN